MFFKWLYFYLMHVLLRTLKYSMIIRFFSVHSVSDCQHPGQPRSHAKQEVGARGLLHEHAEHCAARPEVSHSTRTENTHMHNISFY